MGCRPRTVGLLLEDITDLMTAPGQISLSIEMMCGNPRSFACVCAGSQHITAQATVSQRWPLVSCVSLQGASAATRRKHPYRICFHTSVLLK
jgi:hypothetical protein